MRVSSLIYGIVFLLIFQAGGLPQQRNRLTLEAIFGGSLDEPVPSELFWAPDGRRLGYFLQEVNGEREFWILDVLTGEKERVISSGQAREIAPSPNQALISERERTRRIRYRIPSYHWAPDGKRILFTSSGQLRLCDLATHEAILLAPSKKNLFYPAFSPDGKWISFVYEHDVWAVSTQGGEEKQVTFGGHRLLTHGEPDWIYLEEFGMRTGYCWSPNSELIAFIELNEGSVPVYPIVEQSSIQAEVDFQLYPKAGDPNPMARVGITNLKSRKTIWIKQTAEYIPRIDWADADAVVLQLLNRDQNRLELIEAKAKNGQSRSILSETDAYWLDITDDLTFVSGGREFLWTSDRSGFRHIYLYSRDGRFIRQITAGNWTVEDIAAVDEKNAWIYYRSNEYETIGLNLFRVRMDGSNVERLTKDAGTHAVIINSLFTDIVDSYSSLNRPKQVIVRELVGGKKLELFVSRSTREFDLIAPTIQELTTPDGATIRLLLYKPREIQPGRKYPVVVYVYGMPGVPTIQDAWAGNRYLYHQFLVQQGFVVAQVDDRSSSIPGHKYAVTAYHKLGVAAAKDHELAIRYLKSLPFVDGEALAVWGWSGGGFTVAYHMTHTDLFIAGIAVAPVTDWRLYDSIYTERYMGMPDTDSGAYDRASAVKAAGHYNGRLLLVHGTQDDNVHPQNTIQLARALIRNEKQFDLMLYPGKTHSISGPATDVHLYTLMYEFLQRSLQAR